MASQIKGTVLLARLKYLADHGGPSTVSAVLQRLPLADRAVLKGMLLPVSWYPIALNLRLDEAIADVLGRGDRRKVFVEMGRASAETNLHGAHRSFVRAGDPHYLLSQAAQIYRFYYAVGARSYEKTGARSAVLRTVDAESVSATDCLTIVGWYQRAIEISGGAGARVTETLCRTRGDPHCEYRCEWEPG